jgi:hypothetical protein
MRPDIIDDPRFDAFLRSSGVRLEAELRAHGVDVPEGTGYELGRLVFEEYGEEIHRSATDNQGAFANLSGRDIVRLLSETEAQHVGGRTDPGFRNAFVRRVREWLADTHRDELRRGRTA